MVRISMHNGESYIFEVARITHKHYTHTLLVLWKKLIFVTKKVSIYDVIHIYSFTVLWGCICNSEKSCIRRGVLRFLYRMTSLYFNLNSYLASLNDYASIKFFLILMTLLKKITWKGFLPMISKINIVRSTSHIFLSFLGDSLRVLGETECHYCSHLERNVKDISVIVTTEWGLV